MTRASTAAGGRAAPAVLSALLDLLEGHRAAFRQERPFRRAQALAVGQVLALGRRTLTQCLVALGVVDADWTAFYRLLSRPRLDYATLTRCLLRHLLVLAEALEPWVVVVDQVQMPRASQKMPGTAWLKAPRTPVWRPGIHRAQRFVHLAWLTPRTAQGYSRALPLRLEPACPEKAVRPAGLPARKEWEAALALLRWLRAELDAAGRAAQPLLALGDGVYSTAPFLAGLPERTVVLARCAKNRALFQLPGPQQGRGRRRKYGNQGPHPAEVLRARGAWRQAELLVRGRTIPVRYRVVGPYVLRGAAARPVFLLVVGGIERRRGRRLVRRAPSFWLVTATQRERGWALPLPAETLLAWAWQRWEVEVTHRELKAGFGVGEAQCWGRVSALLAVQWQAWCYSLLVLAGYRVLGLGGGPTPPGRWWRGSPRWSLARLLRAVRQECWHLPEIRGGWSGTSTTWLKTEAWLAAQSAATLGAQRL